MQSLFNRQTTIVIMALGIFPMIGCASKTIEVANSSQKENKMDNEEDYPSFKILKTIKSKEKPKEVCDDCYADVLEIPAKKKMLKKKNNHEYNFKLTSSDIYEKDLDEKKSYANVSTSFSLKSSIKQKYKKNSTKISIQVGAFRRYAGAKVYAKKYDLLSTKYGIKIETGVNSQKPLYRVKIEGFTSKREALEFKDQYSLTGAFLVMK